MEEKKVVITADKFNKAVADRKNCIAITTQINEYKKMFGAPTNPKNEIISLIKKGFAVGEADTETIESIKFALDKLTVKASSKAPKGSDKVLKSIIATAIDLGVISESDLIAEVYEYTEDGLAIKVDPSTKLPISNKVKLPTENVLEKIADKVKNKNISIRQNIIKHLSEEDAKRFEEAVKVSK